MFYHDWYKRPSLVFFCFLTMDFFSLCPPGENPPDIIIQGQTGNVWINDVSNLCIFIQGTKSFQSLPSDTDPVTFLSCHPHFFSASLVFFLFLPQFWFLLCICPLIYLQSTFPTTVSVCHLLIVCYSFWVSFIAVVPCFLCSIYCLSFHFVFALLCYGAPGSPFISCYGLY